MCSIQYSQRSPFSVCILKNFDVLNICFRWKGNNMTEGSFLSSADHGYHWGRKRPIRMLVVLASYQNYRTNSKNAPWGWSKGAKDHPSPVWTPTPGEVRTNSKDAPWGKGKGQRTTPHLYGRPPQVKSGRTVRTPPEVKVRAQRTTPHLYGRPPQVKSGRTVRTPPEVKVRVQRTTLPSLSSPISIFTSYTDSK